MYHICVLNASLERCRLPFLDRKCLFPFQKIHSDLWGLSHVKFVEGFKYYVSFVDDFSRYVWTFPLVNKLETFDVFQKFYNFVFTQFNIGIKCLQFDGGGEFMSKQFSEFLKLKGVLHMVSCPYTPPSKMELLKGNTDLSLRLLSYL